jgi:hypothetical protein
MKCIHFCFLITFMALASMLPAQVDTTYDASGSFVITQTIHDVTIEVWGGGGAGAANGGNNGGGGGGGGGGYAFATFASLPPGTYTVDVGAGGATAGASGGESNFQFNSIRASGGNGGSGTSGGAGGVGSNGSGGTGGTGNNGGGGGGGSASPTADGGPGANASGASGGAGGSGSGDGGNGGSFNPSTNALPGNSPGGGGGGGQRNNNADFGAGAPGRVVISYFEPAPLPVELTRFDARPEIGGIALDWQTASELNNESFTVEHSRDGQRFHALAVLPGAGTTSFPQAYTWVHSQPNTGDNYYRLRQTDFDGAFTYSPMRIAHWSGSLPDAWSIQPSVTSSNTLLRRSIEGPGIQWTLLNIQGQPLITGLIPQDAREQWIDVSHLPAGMYLLHIMDPATPWSSWLFRE